MDYKGQAFRADGDYRVDRVSIRQKTNVAVPSAQPVIFDINTEGISIYTDPSARPHIFDSEPYSELIENGLILDGDWITLDIDQVSPGFGDFAISIRLVELAAYDDE